MNSQTDWNRLHGRSFAGLRVLITGGAGFIGSHLAHALDGLGGTVIVLDDLSGGSEHNLQSCPSVEFVNASILDIDALRRCTAGCNLVFHQAALGSVPLSVEQPRRFHEANVTGTLNVLEAAREAGVTRVMFAASSSAYGDNGIPWIETMPARPMSPYAATKVAGEALLRAYSGSYGLDTVSLRYFNIFGPRQNANSAYAAVIAAFAKAILSGSEPVIYGDGTQSRDFTYVDNAVHANLLAARCPELLCGEVINIGCGRHTSVNDLARIMADAFERPKTVPTYRPSRAGDLQHSVADISLAAKRIGYAPITGFEAGLRKTTGWYADTTPFQTV